MNAVTDFTENKLVEQPAVALFRQLGWESANGYHEFEQPDVGDSAVIRMQPNCLDWVTHMEGTRLLEVMEK